MENHIHEKATSAKKLTEQQKESNRRKSSLRCLIEHVFGFMTNTMKAMYISTIGIVQVEAMIGLANLTYNLMRCVQLDKRVLLYFPEIGASSMSDIAHFRVQVCQRTFN